MSHDDPRLTEGCVDEGEPVGADLKTVSLWRGLSDDLRLWIDLRAFPAFAIWAGLACVAGMLAIRPWVAGPIRFGTGTFCTIAIVGGLLALAARGLLFRIENEPPALWLRLFAAGAGGLPIVTLLLAAAPRNSPLATAIAGGCAALVAAAGLWWHRLFARVEVEPAHAALLRLYDPAPLHERRHDALGTSNEPPAPHFSRASFAGGMRGESREDEAAPHWLRRKKNPDGADVLEGATTVEFAPGQKTATTHLVFCPPFTEIPEFRLESPESSDVRVKIAAVYVYGARLELRRAGTGRGTEEIVLRFTARQSAPSARAA